MKAEITEGGLWLFPEKPWEMEWLKEHLDGFFHITPPIKYLDKRGGLLGASCFMEGKPDGYADFRREGNFLIFELPIDDDHRYTERFKDENPA